MADEPTTTTQAPWYDGVQNADLKGWIAAKGFADPAAAAESAWNLEKLIGQDKAGRTVVLPKDANDAEGLKAFRAKLGVPETPDAYGLEVPEGGNPDFAKTAASWFHKHGVPPDQARGIASEWNAFMKGEIDKAEQAQKAESASQLEALRAKWGNQFDAKAEQARRYMKAFGYEDAEIPQYEAAFGTAKMLERFSAMGAKLAEPGFVSGLDAQGTSPGKAAAAQKLSELRQRYMNNQISQQDYLAQADELARQAA